MNPVLVLAALTLFFAAGCANRTPDAAQAQALPTLVPEVDAAVDAALAKGKATLPRFVAALKNPRADQSRFSVYAVVREGETIEYLWLDDAKLDGDGFRGVVSGVPKILTNIKKGDSVRVDTDDATDWQYVENGKMVGGELLRVAYSQMSERERAEMRKTQDHALCFRLKSVKIKRALLCSDCPCCF